MHASVPSVRSAYKSVISFLERNHKSLSDEQVEAGSELKRRIKRLENDCNRLIKINNALLDAEAPDVDFDEATGVMTVRHKGGSTSIRLNRADPDVPVKMIGSSTTGIYRPGAKEDESENQDQLKMIMEDMIESYYGNAFRITKLIQKVTGREKYHCEEITMVRNKLIEHPVEGAIYSFAFSSTGPIVKPMHRGEREWVDAGLVPNTRSFVDSIEKVMGNDV